MAKSKLKSFLVGHDPNHRLLVEKDGKMYSMPPAVNGLADSTRIIEISGFDALSDNARITERSHLSDPLLERLMRGL